VPVFFVASGAQFDLRALTGSGGALRLVPVLLLALLVVRGLPALLYSGIVGPREMVGAGLLQATSLRFIVTRHDDRA
jgi:Kef-type K+ transport system membrane component KefB